MNKSSYRFVAIGCILFQFAIAGDRDDPPMPIAEQAVKSQPGFLEGCTDLVFDAVKMVFLGLSGCGSEAPPKGWLCTACSSTVFNDPGDYTCHYRLTRGYGSSEEVAMSEAMNICREKYGVGTPDGIHCIEGACIYQSGENDSSPASSNPLK